MNVSPEKRLEILDALRRGTVPKNGVEALAVGLDRFSTCLDEELDRVGKGGVGHGRIHASALGPG